MRHRIVALTIIILLFTPAVLWAQSGSLSGPSSAAEGESVSLEWCASGGATAQIDILDGGVTPDIPISMGCGSTTVTPGNHAVDGVATYRVRIRDSGGASIGYSSELNISISSGGGGGWFPDIEIPDFPTPTEIIEEILAFLFQPVIDTLAGWLGELAGSVAGFIDHHLSLEEDGFLGTMANDGFAITQGLAVPYITISFLLTIAQQMMAKPLPGVFKFLTLEQVLGRILIVVPVCMTPFSRNTFGLVEEAVNRLAWGTIIASPVPGDEFSWVTLLINPMMGMIGGASMSLIIMWSLAILLLFMLMCSMILMNKLLLLIAVIAIPFAGLAWLYPFSESMWGKYWWLVFKAITAPLMLALLVRLNLALLSIALSGGFLGVIVMLVITFVGMSLVFKFLLMAAPVAVGGALIASGNPAGAPILLNSIGGMFGNAGRAAGNDAARAVTLTRQLGGGDEGGGA